MFECITSRYSYTTLYAPINLNRSMLCCICTPNGFNIFTNKNVQCTSSRYKYTIFIIWETNVFTYYCCLRQRVQRPFCFEHGCTDTWKLFNITLAVKIIIITNKLHLQYQCCRDTQSFVCPLKKNLTAPLLLNHIHDFCICPLFAMYLYRYTFNAYALITVKSNMFVRRFRSYF